MFNFFMAQIKKPKKKGVLNKKNEKTVLCVESFS